MAAVLDPEQIIHDLHELWNQLEAEQGNSGGVLRACSMTLLVAAQDDRDAEQARRTLGVLMHDHPSRAVVVHMHDGIAGARVFAECWKPFGSSEQICAEGIEITAEPTEFDQVAQLVVPLRVPDLPVVLWCRGPAAFSIRAFDALFPLASKIIFDSSTASMSAGAALAFLRGLRGRGLRVADLHWTRLTGWREILAHLFDDKALLPRDVISARVLHGGSAPSTCALYFSSWIGHALPSARVKLESAPGAEPGLRSVTLTGSKCEITLTRTSPSCVDVKGCGRDYRCALPPMDEEALMREELNILGPDPVYEQVLG